MKLEFLSFDFDKFAQEMQNLKDKKGFDYLVTIVGEDFGAEEEEASERQAETAKQGSEGLSPLVYQSW